MIRGKISLVFLVLAASSVSPAPAPGNRVISRDLTLTPGSLGLTLNPDVRTLSLNGKYIPPKKQVNLYF